jgi:hypothetical protein
MVSLFFLIVSHLVPNLFSIIARIISFYFPVISLLSSYYLIHFVLVLEFTFFFVFYYILVNLLILPTMHYVSPLYEYAN